MSGTSKRWSARAVVALAAAAVLGAGCRDERGEMAEERATVDTVRETGTARAHGTSMDSASTALRTPGLLPGLEQHLQRLRSDPRTATVNATSYKFMLADVTDAMTEDLGRTASTDTADFVALRDEVMDEVGGGPGSSGTLRPENAREHVAKVERLVSTYRRLAGPAAAPRR